MTNTTPASLPIVATAEVLKEAETLAEDILRDIELSQATLSIVVLKALRLARILNDFETQRIFEWESSGYPRELSGVAPHVWEAAVTAGRRFSQKDKETEDLRHYIYMESIEQLELTLEIGETSLQAATDPDISISSSNQHQMVFPPPGNTRERQNIRSQMHTASARLASRRTFIYEYTARRYYELKFAGVVDDVFGRVRSTVDNSIGRIVPDAVKKFAAVYENLRSDNAEDWANAAHSCRRVLQDLADAIFPAQTEPRMRQSDGKDKDVEIKLGTEQYVNRLIAYIEDSSTSGRFNEIVGSHLRYMGERLDALFGAAQKGSHSTVTREEAERCAVYTYLLVGDILSLRNPDPIPVRPGLGLDIFPSVVEEPQEQAQA